MKKALLFALGVITGMIVIACILGRKEDACEWDEDDWDDLMDDDWDCDLEDEYDVDDPSGQSDETSDADVEDTVEDEEETEAGTDNE